MKIILTYVPIISVILLSFVVDNTLLKGGLLIVGTVLVTFAKYMRIQRKSDDIEFDDRVNENIEKWSLKIIYILNTILIVLLVVDSSNLIPINMNKEIIILILLLTLYVPFYIVPVIVKKF